MDVYRVYFAQFIENLTIFVEHNSLKRGGGKGRCHFFRVSDIPIQTKKMLYNANHTFLESPFSFYPRNNYPLNIPEKRFENKRN